MNILGIDPGADCGWALYQDGQWLSGTWHLQPKGTFACGDHPLLYLQGHLRNVGQISKLDLIVFETPVGYVGSIGRTMNAVSAGSQKVGVIIAESTTLKCHWLGLRPAEVKAFAKQQSAVRDCFDTKGQATKEQMVKAAEMYFGKRVTSDDEADALWLAEYGRAHYESILKAPVCGG